MMFAKNSVYNILHRQYPYDISLDCVAVMEKISDNYYHFRICYSRIDAKDRINYKGKPDVQGSSLKINKRNTKEYLIEQIGTLENFPEYEL